MSSKSTWVPLRHIRIGGQRVAVASRKELTSALISDCKISPAERKARLVFDVNGQGLSLASTSPEYCEAMKAAHVVHADGGFIVTLSRFLGADRISERSATTDLMEDFSQAAVEHSLTVYLLGGTPDANEMCRSALSNQYPGIKIVGNRHGYFSAAEETGIVEDISRLNPDLLWVGLGKPKEQQFLARHGDALRAGWAVTCGGCFNFVSGSYSRAPQWMQKTNLEWSYRLLKNPRQFFWRYAKTNPHALYLALFRTNWRQAPHQ